jgi:signal transduction histidine kinase
VVTALRLRHVALIQKYSPAIFFDRGIMTFAAASRLKTAHGHTFHMVTWAAASCAVAIGVFMLVAWCIPSEWLWVTAPGMFYMKFNTSLAFIAGGAGLLTALRGKKTYTLWAGAILLGLGGLTLIQFLAGVNFGLDEFVLTDYWYPDNPLRGRMAPSESLAFTCFGTVLILLAAEERRKFSHVVTMEVLAFVVLALGATALAGYLTQAEFAYSWGSAARVTTGAALGLVALGIGLVALIWRYLSIRIARVPLWIPILLCFLVLLLDLSTPIELAAGIAYIPIIFCSLWFTQPYMAFIFAATTTALTVLGHFASPPTHAELWIVFGNRTLTISALWFVATLVYLRQRAAQALAIIASELERSNQELDDFAYIASHDLKEPLRGLFNHASFLLEDYKDKLDEDGVRRLARLGALCQRMEGLIDDLMYFSRLGRAELASQKTDPNLVIAEIRQMMEQVLSERNASIVMPWPLPKIICDKALVTEVFRNLISNAVKYNDKTEPVVEIGFLAWVDTDAGLASSVFYVKDNGVGIEREFHQEIFRIFKRLERPAEGQQAGTGVGLTFVKKIVERHGGRIWLESDPGNGTIFYFNLNLEQNRPARGIHDRGIIPIPVHSAG